MRLNSFSYPIVPIALALCLGTAPFAQSPLPGATAEDRAEARAIFKQLIEINTTDTAKGNVTAGTAAMVAVHGAGKHAGDEERIVADVLADGALGVERGRGAVDGVGGEDHCAEVFNGMAGLVADFVEIVSLGKFTEQMGDVGGDIGIVETEFALVAVAHDLLEEWFERMSLRLHRDLP